MTKNIDLAELKKQLPRGAVKAIAERTGLSVCVVSRTINSDKKTRRYIEILKATAEIMAENKATELEAIQTINEVMNPETPEQLTARLNRQREKYGETNAPLLSV